MWKFWGNTLEYFFLYQSKICRVIKCECISGIDMEAEDTGRLSEKEIVTTYKWCFLSIFFFFFCVRGGGE